MNGLANDKDNVNREAIYIPSPYLPILSVDTATTDTTLVDVKSTWTNIEGYERVLVHILIYKSSSRAVLMSFFRVF